MLKHIFANVIFCLILLNVRTYQIKKTNKVQKAFIQTHLSDETNHISIDSKEKKQQFSQCDFGLNILSIDPQGNVVAEGHDQQNGKAALIRKKPKQFTPSFQTPKTKKKVTTVGSNQTPQKLKQIYGVNFTNQLQNEVSNYPVRNLLNEKTIDQTENQNLFSNDFELKPQTAYQKMEEVDEKPEKEEINEVNLDKYKQENDNEIVQQNKNDINLDQELNEDENSEDIKDQTDAQISYQPIKHFRQNPDQQDENIPQETNQVEEEVVEFPDEVQEEIQEVEEVPNEVVESEEITEKEPEIEVEGEETEEIQEPEAKQTEESEEVEEPEVEIEEEESIDDPEKNQIQEEVEEIEQVQEPEQVNESENLQEPEQEVQKIEEIQEPEAENQQIEEVQEPEEEEYEEIETIQEPKEKVIDTVEEVEEEGPDVIDKEVIQYKVSDEDLEREARIAEEDQDEM